MSQEQERSQVIVNVTQCSLSWKLLQWCSGLEDYLPQKTNKQQSIWQKSTSLKISTMSLSATILCVLACFPMFTHANCKYQLSMMQARPSTTQASILPTYSILARQARKKASCHSDVPTFSMSENKGCVWMTTWMSYVFRGLPVVLEWRMGQVLESLSRLYFQN